MKKNRDELLNKENMEIYVQDMLRKQEERHHAKVQFANTHLKDVMERVYVQLQASIMLDEEHIRYQPEKYSVTSEEFTMLFEMFELYGNEYTLHGQDTNAYFKHQCYYLLYRDAKILLRVMWGQGTALQMFLVPDNEQHDNPLVSTKEDIKEEIHAQDDLENFYDIEEDEEEAHFIWRDELAFSFQEVERDILSLLMQESEQSSAFKVKKQAKKLQHQLSHIHAEVTVLLQSADYANLNENIAPAFENVVKGLNESRQSCQEAITKLSN